MMSRVIRMPHASARKPASAVRAKPPMPVAVVIMPVAVAVLLPANDKDKDSEQGYIAPLAKPSGMQRSMTSALLFAAAMRADAQGIAMMQAKRMRYVCFA